MKNLLLLLAFSLITQCLSAQACANGQSQIDIHGNNIQARILSGGDLFSSAEFIPNPGPIGTLNPSTIYAAGIWMGGIDPGGNLKLAAVDYRTNSSFDFTPGPLSPNGMTESFTCANWDRHFRTTGAEIAAFQAALPLSAAQLKTQFPGVAGWPGRENPYFLEIYGFDLPFTIQALAPFFDANQDGRYDPLDGDYPVVELRGLLPFVPAEIIWCVFNDQNGGSVHSNSYGKPFQVEIQLTTWAFNCPNESVANNTLFTSHKIINRAAELADSVFIGIWADVDLGCGSDDYVGCNPDLNTMYAYNTDAVDGQPGNTCQGVPTFPGVAPTQSVTFLNHTLDKFIPYNNSGGSTPPGTTDPTTTNEFYNYLTGSWRDGSPLTDGPGGYGSGNPVDHIYTDDPSDPTGWSMCTAGLPTADRRLFGTTKLGQLFPGQVEEVIVAWAFHPNPSLPCDLGTTLSDVAKLHTMYENGFTDLCLPLKAPELPAGSLQLFPNPTSGTALLQYGVLRPLSLRAFDAAGRMVLEKIDGFEKEETKIETASLGSGIYTLQIVTEQGTATKKLVVMR